MLRLKLNPKCMLTFLGEKFLKTPYTSAKVREKAFLFVNICTIVAFFFIAATMVLNRNEPYSIYICIRNDYNWFTSLFVFVLFLCFAMIESWDLGCNVLLIYNIIYFSCFSMQFWLQKIWYVDHF